MRASSSDKNSFPSSQHDHTLTMVMERSQGGRTEDAQFRTVVGADGAVSRVAQAAGWPKPRTVPLVQAIVDLPKGMTPDTVRVWFIPDDTPYFYWLIPHSPTEGVVGLIGEDGTRDAAGSGTIPRKASP